MRHAFLIKYLSAPTARRGEITIAFVDPAAFCEIGHLSRLGGRVSLTVDVPKRQAYFVKNGEGWAGPADSLTQLTGYRPAVSNPAERHEFKPEDARAFVKKHYGRVVKVKVPA